MASLKDLKNRITSVQNTQKTTKAMKMVSAAKLRRSQDAIFAHRPYAKKIDDLIQMVSANADLQFVSRLIKKEIREGKPKALLVLVTSDRGLCGGFNSSVQKKAVAWMNEKADQYESIEVAYAGRKVREISNKFRWTEAFYTEFGNKASFDVANKLTQWVLDAYSDDRYDEVHVVYNEFKNAITQTTQVVQFLPLLNFQNEKSFAEQKEEAGITADQFVIQPDAATLLERLLEKHFAVQIFRIFLESQAGEHGARMAAMDNATRNAGEMIDKLTLQYNKNRQAKITTELMEITAGVESQKQV